GPAQVGRTRWLAMTTVKLEKRASNKHDRCRNPRRGARRDLDAGGGVVALDGGRPRGRRGGVAVPGADADPGTAAGIRAQDRRDLRDAAVGAALHGGLAARRDDADLVANHRRLT